MRKQLDSPSVEQNGQPGKLMQLLGWIDARFPLTALWKQHLSEYHAPKNFNFWYYFGVLACVVLVLQIITGIFLAIHYKPDGELAFYSIETIMREVPYGWLIRYAHSTGASLFFVVIYLHIFRAILYGSFRKPRELIWIIGLLIFLCLMAEAFLGYLLPWGQTSYWGAKVIISLIGVIPLIGESLSTWIQGDYVLSGVTLNRFFVFHVVLIPLCLIGLTVVHLLALHTVGSNNPDGVEIHDHVDEKGVPLDSVPFFPYYIVKDMVAIVVFFAVFIGIIAFAPDMNGFFLEYSNFTPMDLLKTPDHIAPVWYFMPFYSMLRASTINFFFIDAKFWGFVLVACSVLIWFALPWLDRSPVKSIRYKGPIFKTMLAVFVVSFLALGFLGTLTPTDTTTIFCQVFTVGYFAFFVGMPWYSTRDRCKTPPERLTL